jgi:membrane associated rhomboid family serine protease
MNGPDLFVVCKNCNAEVSPYITECPYCGNRLRKRAPKIERDGRSGDAQPKAPKRSRGARTVRPVPDPKPRRERRFGSGGSSKRERASWEPRKPVVSMTIVLASVLFTLAGKLDFFDPLTIVVGSDDDRWLRIALAPFFYFRTGYELAALGVVFLFGWLLERRHGWWAALLVFLATAIGGMAAQAFIEPDVFASGASGGALGLLAAWVVRDLLMRRRGEETESDLLGVLVIAVVLILVPIAAEEARPFAGASGGIIGFALGFLLARAPARD